LAWAPVGMDNGHLFFEKDNKKALLSQENRAMHAQIQWTKRENPVQLDTVKGRADSMERINVA